MPLIVYNDIKIWYYIKKAGDVVWINSKAS